MEAAGWNRVGSRECTLKGAPASAAVRSGRASAGSFHGSRVGLYPLHGSAQPASGSVRLVARGIVLGLGLGGFVDGIVLHQVAQWHNMLSSTDRWPATTLEGIERNMLADGLFHAAMWVLVALGLWLLWKARREAGQASGWELVGWMLAGWGIFNLVEGVIDHQLLGIHHVRGESLAWDLSFLAFGAVLLLGGWLLARGSPALTREAE
jgi:uncharacterized membrane protein